MTVTACELLRMSYVALTTQFTVARIARNAVVGPQVFAQGIYAGRVTAYEDFIRDNIISTTDGLAVEVKEENITISCIAETGCGDTVGIPGALVSIEARVPVRLLGLFEVWKGEDWQFTIRSVTVTRNEWW